MPRKSRKKVKDLVEFLEDPDGTTYIGGDYEDIMEMIEKEMTEPEEDEEGYEEVEE